MCLGVIGRLTAVWEEGGVPMGMVESDDRGEAPACLLYTPDAAAGDDVLVHSGFVVDVLAADRAAEARALRAEMRVPPGPVTWP